MKKYILFVALLFCVPSYADTCVDWGTNAYSASNYEVYRSGGGDYCSSYTTKYMFNQTTSTRIQYTTCNSCGTDGYIPTTETIPDAGGYGCALTYASCRGCPSGTWGGGTWDECFDCPSDYPYSFEGTPIDDKCYRLCKTADVSGALTVDGQYYYDGTNKCTATYCKSNYYKSGTACTACPTSFPNSASRSTSVQQCYKTCSTTPIAEGKIYNDGSSTCLASYCNAGYYKSSDSCLTCPEITGVYTNSSLTTVAKTTSVSRNTYGQASCYIAAGTYYDKTGSYTISAPANSCVLDSNFDISSVDKSVSATTTGYNSTAKTWWAQFSYGTIAGVSTCVTTATGSIGTVKSSDAFSEFDTSGMYCWCKMTSPAISGWVAYVSIGSATSCVNNCASSCAAQFTSSTTFRTNMYNSVN